MIASVTNVRAVALILLIFGVISSGPALAQSVDIPVPPVRSSVDERGVNLTSGGVEISDPQISIGTSSNGLVHTRYWPGKYGWRHSYMISAAADAANHVTVTIGGSSTGFTLAAGVYSSDQGDGAALTENASSYTYTGTDGTTIYLDKTLAAANTSYYGTVSALGTIVTPPTGLKTYLTYKRSSFTYIIFGNPTTVYVARLQSVRNSAGFQFKYSYASNSLSIATVDAWVSISSVMAINNAVDYCDPTADSCSGFTQTWPSVSYGVTTSGTDKIEAVTDAVSRVKRYTTNSTGKLIGIRRPSSGSDNVTYAYDANSRISSVVVAGVGTWTYSFSLSSPTLTATVTTPSIPVARTIVTNTTILQPTSITDENGKTTVYTYDGTGRLKTVTAPEGNYATYNYDGRGNPTSTVATPKSGSGLATVTTSATYAATCTNVATCNKPVTSTDAASKVTNYYYNSNGTPDYVQAPAPVGGAARPEVHYSYVSVSAWLKNAAGSVVVSSDAMTLPIGTTSCITGAWPCSTANQAVTDFDYYGGPSATNTSLQSTTVRSGSGSPTATTSYTYDHIGNLTATTDPLSNVTSMSYAADRQLLSLMSPSIDGSPTSRRRIMLLHYNSDGLIDSRSLGTVNPNGSGYTALQIQPIGYDSAGRKNYEALSDGSTTYAVSQYSYDSAGRLSCTAVRMNPAIFGSLPAACTLGTAGSFGSDRITHYVWEYAGALGWAQTGYGTALQRDEIRYTRTNNGQLATVTDAKGNVTSYTYDGHDRPLKTCYNASLSSCVSGSATDFVLLTYDSVGRLTNRSLRGTATSTTIGYGYDDLGRLKTVDYPGASTFDSDVTLAYDNLGRVLSSTDANSHSATFGYDALGRVTSQGDAISSRTMLYDANGRRTRLTWSDGRYVTYGYNGVGEMTSILESGSTSLAAFAYDDLGRRSSLTRGNGVVTSYGYDGASRLTSLVNDLAGTVADQTLGFTGYSPAGQIATRTSSNDLYAWTQHYNVNRNYTTNGLNQYTASGAVTPTYDVKGNLASAGGSTYTYSTKNELVTTSDTGIQFYHDPLGQLDAILNAPGGSRGFQYDGGQIVTEIGAPGSFPIVRRYVFGPGADEALIWYEGADFSDKRYLVADERGSVVAVTNAAGNPIAINSYDEYGIPASTNMGRFQYTGQAWLPELGMYSYKARIYSPTLGRFLQTDPIGYDDGVNWYNYTGSDPVNATDPTGTSCENGYICPIGDRDFFDFQLSDVTIDVSSTFENLYWGNTDVGATDGDAQADPNKNTPETVVTARRRAIQNATSVSVVTNIGGDSGEQTAAIPLVLAACAADPPCAAAVIAAGGVLTKMILDRFRHLQPMLQGKTPNIGPVADEPVERVMTLHGYIVIQTRWGLGIPDSCFDDCPTVSID
jgi:RHS repeat-associated protein